MNIKENNCITGFLTNPEEQGFDLIVTWLKGNVDECERKEVATTILDIIAAAQDKLPLEKTIEFSGKSIAIFANQFPRYFSDKMQLINALCKLYIKNNQIDKAHEKATSFLYNAIARLYPKASNEGVEYYSFRGFSSYSLDDIKNETISVAHPREFNDPFDTLFNVWMDLSIDNDTLDKEEREFRILLRKSAEHLKMRCLISATSKNEEGHSKPVSIEELDTLMWAHYANSHKGFCVKYKFSDDFFCDYSASEDTSLRMINGMHYDGNISFALDDFPDLNQAILTKSKNWEYEKEMRLISFYVKNHKDANDEKNDEPAFPAFKCAGAAKAIYLGIKCSDADRRNMEAAIGDKNIELYQMVYDQDNLTKLKAKRIG